MIKSAGKTLQCLKGKRQKTAPSPSPRTQGGAVGGSPPPKGRGGGFLGSYLPPAPLIAPV